MGRGKRQYDLPHAVPPPKVLAGDFIEIVAADTLIPVDGSVVEVNAVHNHGSQLSVIAGGRAVMTVDWEQGDRWQRAAPPSDLPPSYIRSSAAPSNGLETAHSWHARPEPSHPAVVSLGADFDGWMRVEGDKRLVEVVDGAWYQVYEYGDAQGWEENVGSDLGALDPGLIERAVQVGELVAEADCANSGFVLHTFFPELELRVHCEDDRKGLEAIVFGLEELGLTVSFRRGYAG